MQPAQAIKLKGPPVSAAFDKDGKPTAAATKFAEKCGVDVAALTRVTEGKGEFLYFEGSQAGPSYREPAAGHRAALARRSCPIPKRMRWGSSERGVRAARALAGACCSATDVVPARILDTDAGRTTRGHRFMAPQELALAQPADYEATLREQGKVIAGLRRAPRAHPRAGRRAAASRWPAKRCSTTRCSMKSPRWSNGPAPIAGSFEARFLELPREVLISTLQQHQRYFPVQDAARQAAAAFHHRQQYREPRARQGARRQ